MPLLNGFLSSPDNAIRAGAAEVLGNIGPKAKAALPKLTELANERDIPVRHRAAEALWKIDRCRLMPSFLFASMSCGPMDEASRWSAATFIGEAGPQAKAAVPALIEVLQKDKSNRVRGKAAMALGQIGPDANSAIPALDASLQDEYSAMCKPRPGKPWKE